MPSHNSVTLIGNLTRDIELVDTPKSVVAKFSLAINRQWTTESGEKREEVTFVDCEAWQKSAEILAKYSKKGDPLLVVGSLKSDSWDDKTTGAKRSKMIVRVENFQFLGGKRDGAQAVGGATKLQDHMPDELKPEMEGEEIPF